ncbi:tyrosine-protein kinase Dnt [Contarinia nasturtii]|uniref:tyrosine-protein kinase Dnt n=1 Tax=Contarinia nasturtii TaxID=265458 RepID=UPI0012D4054A|nr:tyrosine-protein kinase Dnt [Contarinia nasturtii]
MKNLHKLLAFVGITMIATPNVAGHLNLFLNQHEVMRLLGLSAELYYVRDGLVNEYALHFTVPVPGNIHDITFTWQSLAGRPLPYKINIESSDLTVLPRPTMNISRLGSIPTDIETFSIDMQCSGLRSAEVDVTITIEVTLNRATNNVTELVFRRKKICLEVEPTEKISNTIDDPLLLETMSVIAPTGLLTLIIGGVLALMLVLILISIAYCARSPTKRGGHSQPLRTSSFQRLQTHAPSAPPSIVFPPAPPTSTLPRSERINERTGTNTIDAKELLTIHRYRVRLSKVLQEGTFGRVFRGTYNDEQEVLVKTVAQHASKNQVSLLLKEGTRLYAASHPAILPLLGVSIDDISTPFLLYAASADTVNLKLFLNQEPSSRTLTTIQIVMMSYQLAVALGHLHSHQVLHCDVAARNCVINEQLQVKLTDSSLARDLFPEDYSCLGDSENRPIKWMALETLQKNEFSEASDTWAFGVLMWELCTLARQPYQEINNDDMEQFLSEGFRLAQPVNCPDELFTIMAYCWALLPHERPSFGQLKVCLQEFHNQLTRYV